MPHPRKETIAWVPGHYYHIYNRGARRKSIFYEEENYLMVIRNFKKYCRQFNLTLIAYCLMPNHYHLLVRQNGSDRAGLLPQRSFLSYTHAFNRRYNESGTLFEGRFKTKHVNTEPYLCYLCKYIHFNPVKDGIVSTPDSWLYSNYLDWIGEREGTLLDKEFIKDHFQSGESYRREMHGFLVDGGYEIDF